MNATLTGQVAIVTGAAHGIGLGVARALGDEGATVVAVDIDSDGLSRAPLPDGTRRVVGDVTRDAERILDQVAELGTVSFLFNNIGKMDGRSFLELPDEVVEENVRSNIVGQWVLTRRVVDRMIKQRVAGSIVFNLSLHTSRVRMCPDYSVSKAGLLMLVQELATELGPYGIRVNAVSPGAIDTWSDRVPDPEEHRRNSEAMVPLGRLGDPADVAPCVVFLADQNRSGYITGADIRIDGGLNNFNWLHHLYGAAANERRRLGGEHVE